MVEKDTNVPASLDKNAIQPTVGRVVWFRPHKTDFLAGGGADQPLIGLVAHVNSNNSVNLAVFDSSGHSAARTNVQLIQDGDDAPGDKSYAEWMPFQKGQAAKAEVAEAAKTGGGIGQEALPTTPPLEGLLPAPLAPAPVAPVSTPAAAPLAPVAPIAPPPAA